MMANWHKASEEKPEKSGMYLCYFTTIETLDNPYCLTIMEYYKDIPENILENAECLSENAKEVFLTYDAAYGYTYWSDSSVLWSDCELTLPNREKVNDKGYFNEMA